MGSIDNAVQPDIDTAVAGGEGAHSAGGHEPGQADDSQEPDRSAGGDQPDPDVSPPPDHDGPTVGRRRRPRMRWVAGIAMAALVAGAGYEGWLLYQQHDRNVAAQQALEAARNYAVTLTSIDTNAIDENFASVLDGATGEFKAMYAQSSGQLRQLLIDNEATAHGTVIDAAVRSTDDDRVEVLLFVDQSVSNLVVPEPRIDRSRIRMTMQKVGGEWLASKVELP
ncbi:Mce protein [Mycolicibacterium alvei]|uniref:Mce protein n=1 Tax=Mycolicibacterium alvei TaxID=67081 RepID=A0A6N4UYU1_9MYCO|nr:Mce protein [Mycolicibacterium alvei]MCV7000084.1 Mce protein [Mycolicibacterium alvei]BBX30110.1 hypothetical protein MALV_52350 [Mycolicibacterium alvei]